MQKYPKTLKVKYLTLSLDKKDGPLWLEYNQGWASTSAIRYKKNSFGYDRPNVWPKFITNKIEKLYQKLNAQFN